MKLIAKRIGVAAIAVCVCVAVGVLWSFRSSDELNEAPALEPSAAGEVSNSGLTADSPLVASPDSGAKEGVENVREESGLVRARVLWGGVAVAGADVRIVGSNTSEYAKSDRQGRVLFTRPIQTPFDISGWTDFAFASERISLPDQAARTIVLELARKISLRVTLRSPMGAPLQGTLALTRYRALPAPGDRGSAAERLRSLLEEQQVPTDKDGNISVSILPGAYILEAFAEGHASRSRSLWIAEGEDQRIDFVLEAGARIAGSVVDGQGAPIVGATVQLSGLDDSLHAPTSTQTSERGLFETWTRPGDARITARGSRYSPSTVMLRAPASDVRLVLRGFGSIEGTAVLGDGRPAVGAGVTLNRGQDVDQDSRPLGEVLVGGDGAFQHREVPPGKYRVQGALQLGVSPGDTRRAGVEVLVQEAEVQRVRLVFGGEAGLSGRVLDENRLPIPGATVVAQRELLDGEKLPTLPLRHESRSEAGDGAFNVNFLERGRYRVSASHPDYVFGGLKTDSGATDLLLIGRRKGSVTGEVRTPSNRPVRVFRLNGDLVEDTEGRFSIPVSVDDDLRVTVSADGFGPTERTIRARRGETRSLGTIYLQLPMILHGRVIDAATSEPIGDVQVALGQQSLWTDWDGTFAVAVPDNDVHIRFQHPAFIRADARLQRGQLALLQKLERGGSVYGSVMRANGERVMGWVQIRAVPPSSGFGSTRIDAEGNYRITLPGGTYSATVNYRSVGQSFDLPVGGSVHLDLIVR